MRRQSRKTCLYPALTLTETVMSLSIMAIIFAVLLPQLRTIQNSWDSQAGASETLQNGRVLTEHLHRNLSKAARMTAVSDSSTTSGYIEFIDNDANTFRYDVNSTSSYVAFGPVGSLSDLAGPVSQFQFACYDALDLGTPITDVNSIRNVNVKTTLTNSASLDQDMTFSTQAYIRANTLPAAGISKMSDPWPAFDLNEFIEPTLAQIDSTHYLCAYQGYRDDGWACILTVNPIDWSVSAGGFLEYDIDSGLRPALSQIDSTHYLCAYGGVGNDGWATVLTVDTGTWTITNQTPFEYDTSQGLMPALSQIDSTHYLCAYQGYKDDGWACILTVNPIDWSISAAGFLEYDITTGLWPALSQIDSTHYLCVYAGPGTDGWATVLTVDTGTWTITNQTPFEYDIDMSQTPVVSKMDDTHYLCVYQGGATICCALVLTVDTGSWTITKETAFEFGNTIGQDPDLSQIDSTSFLCAYGGPDDQAVAVVLNVDTGNWTVSISEDAPFVLDEIRGNTPALCLIDGSHYLCSYAGLEGDGYAGVLELSEGIFP